MWVGVGGWASVGKCGCGWVHFNFRSVGLSLSANLLVSIVGGCMCLSGWMFSEGMLNTGGTLW